MKSFRFPCLLALLALLLTAVACTQDDPAPNDREPIYHETFVPLEGTEMTFADGLDIADYPATDAVGTWLSGCSAPDRDDYFDAYILRHEASTEGNTTFTYLIYYPHEGESLSVTPELLRGEDGYAICLTYTEGNMASYSLSYLSVTLPTADAPELSFLVGEEELGLMSTVTDQVIPLPAAE